MRTILAAIAALIFVIVIMGGARQVFGLDLSTITNASIHRVDHPDGDVHVNITLNLNTPYKGSTTYRTDYCLTVASGEANTVKNGTTTGRNALRKKYIRLAVEKYLTEKTASAPATNTDQGTSSVAKSAFTEVGDQ